MHWQKRKTHNTITNMNYLNEAYNMKDPKGAQYYVDGIYWKLGVNNKVYKYVNDYWITSTRSIDDIRKACRK